MKPDFSKEVLDYLNSVAAKRPRTVIQHILANGHVTSEELKNIYGYSHPPRAIRDVRELGISITTGRTMGENGHSIGDYRFDEMTSVLSMMQTAKALGRTAFSKALKTALIEKYGARCFIYLEAMDAANLQIDHRVPYEIAGEQADCKIEDFMLLCPSANRTKSWVCEHCENWQRKEPAFCLRCFWAHPENYEHVAGKPERIISLVFSGEEVRDYDKLVKMAGEKEAQKLVKGLIHEYLESLTQEA